MKFQKKVILWVKTCFGLEACRDIPERNHRFIEEALELVQSTGCTKEDVLMLVDYVYGRPVGKPYQEIGGVMVTFASLCDALNLDMDIEGEKELKRVWLRLESIRKKQASRPKNSPLPMHMLCREHGKNINECKICMIR